MHPTAPTAGPSSGPGRLPPEARYRTDPVFRSLVDMMYHALLRLEYTPTELREAVIFAASKYELLHVTPILIPTGEPDRET